jgi:hypothetical protein
MSRTISIFLFLLLLATAAPAAAPQYTIAQLYSSAKRAPEIKGAKSFAENAVITSMSYRVDKGNVNRYYFDPYYGKLIRELLEKDTFVSWWEIDGFMRRHAGRIDHVSLYPEGFVLVQLEQPQNVLIIPVSLKTVQRGEELVRQHLKLQ